MKAYNRISDDPLTIHCQVTHPQIVAVVDPTLLGMVDVLEGVPEDGIVIVNTANSPSQVREKLRAGTRKVFTVDATRIALETMGRPLPNTPMLGALARASGEIELSDLLAQVKKNFGKKFSQKVVEGNLLAVKRAYQEVQGESSL